MTSALSGNDRKAKMRQKSDSRSTILDRQSSKSLKGTRVALLNYIHGLLDNREESRLIWLHGTAGVGKSAVAFTVAERMRSLKVTERTNIETRLAGTFFFSRKHTERCTTGYFFATLAYQLACNFPSVREDVNRTIRENPALLDPNKSLRDQMEGLFLKPLRRLQPRLRECPPSTFVVDALDEGMSETEVADLISLLGRALREPNLPVIHILLTSRSEAHIREAIQGEDVHPLVCEIPVKISGEGVAAIISLGGADVDDDIYIFLEHSFRKLRSRYSNFPKPTSHELARLASRAGRRFIVASTMMKFIDDGYHDPRDRLHLMLELTSELLPGTEVYKLYDRILATCTNPARAYLHLSVVASLANPLSISQISELLGPGEGRDVETALMQLRSVMDIPTESSLPVNIHHSSVRDYVSDPSNCSLPEVQPIASPHALLAYSSLRLMMQDIPSTALPNALAKLKKQSRATQSHDSDPQTLTRSLSFIVQSPEPLQVLKGLLWLQGDRSLYLQSWLETLDGHEWLHAQCVHNWLQSQGRKDWLRTQEGMDWLQTQGGGDWLQTQGGQFWLKTRGGQFWLQAQGGRDWLRTHNGHFWLRTACGQDWLRTRKAEHWLQTQGGRNWLQTRAGREWLQTESGRWWLQAQQQDWLQTPGGKDWLESQEGRDWLDESQSGQEWLYTRSGQEWLHTRSGQDWLHTRSGQEWLHTRDARLVADYTRPATDAK
ncbi:hypothetical protein EV702DRAFT_1269567 [Suillus placidus]|uniref:NACHT domain-containing protein n=1 Tax=Suillus placidus TaxID=48579 RepID=A0A9P6ZR75_9AGAM|nr:hypothetical protein EV702DRAFT_1269567 [Suillus placidus]